MYDTVVKYKRHEMDLSFNINTYSAAYRILYDNE